MSKQLLMWFPRIRTCFNTPDNQDRPHDFRLGKDEAMYKRVSEESRAEDGTEGPPYLPHAVLGLHFRKPASMGLTMLFLVITVAFSFVTAGFGFWIGLSHGCAATICPKCYVDDQQCTIHFSPAC